MRIQQALRKLRSNKVLGLNPTTGLYEDTLNPGVLEVSGHWISERVSFNSRRVLLVEQPLSPTYSVLKLGDEPERHILYSGQKNIYHDTAAYYDYTLLDETDEASIIRQVTTISASGIQGSTVETTVDTLPVHLVRFGQTPSDEADFIFFSRQYAFLPAFADITTADELQVGTDRFTIQDIAQELLTMRITMVKR